MREDDERRKGCENISTIEGALSADAIGASVMNRAQIGKNQNLIAQRTTDRHIL